jgi:hypothetical protein
MCFGEQIWLKTLFASESVLVSKISDTGHSWQLGDVPLNILVFGWRRCDNFSPRYSTLGTRRSFLFSLKGVILQATCNAYEFAKAKMQFNTPSVWATVVSLFFARKPVERPKVSRLSEISDTGHSWAADRRPADHFGLWLEALR